MDERVSGLANGRMDWRANERAGEKLRKASGQCRRTVTAAPDEGPRSLMGVSVAGALLRRPSLDGGQHPLSVALGSAPSLDANATINSKCDAYKFAIVGN